MIEAKCRKCGETFIPTDENDLEHIETTAGQPCGGRGEVVRTATYHGIVRAKCLTCGYESTDVTEMSMWNDYGVDCIKNDCEGISEWEMIDGRVMRVDTEGNDVTAETLRAWVKSHDESV